MVTSEGDTEREGGAREEGKAGMEERNGEYVRLWEEEGTEAVVVAPGRWRSAWWWSRVVLACLCLAGATAVFFVWGFPFLLNKVAAPTLDWVNGTFSMPVLGLILFATIAVFPTFLIPSSPSIWIAGVTYGYFYGFLLIMAATSVGMSLPFFIGSLFQHRIHKWLERWPKKAAFVRLAGEGDWIHQFRAVTLLRISPFPYIIFNYVSVATNVKYGPYIFGSIIGAIPDTLIAMYSGFLIQNLAAASGGHQFLSVEQIVYDAIGFCIAASSTTAITIYAKRTLQNLQSDDQLV